MRFAVAVLALLAAAAVARADRLDEAQRAELVRVLGGDGVWGELPPWRQRMIAKRYAAYLGANERKRAAVAEVGLRTWLLRPGGEIGRDRVPPELRREIERLPEEQRRFATKFAVIRLHQLRLDRHLSFVPFEERRALFRRLFPEPFDRAAARAARKELERHATRAIAARVRERLRDVPGDDRAARALEFVREETRREEAKVLRRVAKELPRRRPPARLDATPRQRELIRYAARPRECPLVRPDLAGPRPEGARARRTWERDFRILARLELLTEAGLPHEMVLHLAGPGSAEEFLRSIQALRGRGRARSPGN